MARQLNKIFALLNGYRATAMILNAQTLGWSTIQQELNLSDDDIAALQAMPTAIEQIRADYLLWHQIQLTGTTPPALSPGVYAQSIAQRQQLLVSEWTNFFRHVPIKPGVHLADYGGGSGYLTRLMATIWQAGRVLLYDRPDMIRAARDLAIPDLFYTLELVEIDLLDQTSAATPLVDCVFAGELCHGKSSRENRIILQRAWQQLKPGGTCIVTELQHKTYLSLGFDIQMRLRTPGGHHYTDHELLTLMQQAGFTALTVQYPTQYHFAIVGHKV